MISNLVIDIVKKYYKKRASEVLSNIENAYSSGNTNKINDYKKRYSYYCGDTWKLKMLEKQMKNQS